MKSLTPAQRRMIDDVHQKIDGNYPYLNANGGVVVQANRNGYATAHKLIELGIMEDVTEAGMPLLAIKPVGK